MQERFIFKILQVPLTEDLRARMGYPASLMKRFRGGKKKVSKRLGTQKTFAHKTELVAQTVKRLFTMRETWVRSLGWEDSPEKEMATHSSTLALKIPWTEEHGAGYCPWGRKELGMTERLHFHCWPDFINPLQPWALRSYLQCARRSVVSDSLPTRLLHPGKNTGVSCHFLLLEIFLTQGLTPGLQHCRQMLYHLSHQGRSIVL